MEILMQNARVSFASGLFKASAFEAGQVEKFGADFLIDGKTKVFLVDATGKKTPTTLPAVMLAVAEDAWPKKGKEMLQSFESSKKCYRDGNKRLNKTGDPYEGYADIFFVAAKNKTRPGLFDLDGKTEITEASGRLYSGCRVNASIGITAQTDPTKKGVHAVVRGVQFAGDDEAFSGGAPVRAGFFEPLAEGADSSDLT